MYCVSGREKRLPLMAASSVPPFLWIDRMIAQALTCMLEVVRGGRDGRFDEENIRQAVIICRSTSTSSSHSSLLQQVTVGQLTQLLSGSEACGKTIVRDGSQNIGWHVFNHYEDSINYLCCRKESVVGPQR